MSEWKEMTLKELGTLARGKSKHRPRYAFHLYGGPYPFIQTGDVKAASRKINNYNQTYSEAGLAQSKLWPKGTLCITIAANIAEVGILEFDACFPDSVLGFIPNQNITDTDFIYYSLVELKKELQALGEGSVQDNINLGTFEDFKIPIPPLSQQQRIAEVLSSLDDKIDLLHRQNQTLEQLAETLFRQWFVEEADDNWQEGKLEDLCEIISSGGTPSTKQSVYYGGDVNWYSTKELNDNFLFESLSKITEQGLLHSSAKLFPIGTVVIAIYAAPTVGRLGILATEAAFNQAACGLVADQKKCSKEFLYLFLKSQREELNQLATGSAQQNLNVGKIKNYPLLIPPKAVFDKLKAFAEPVFQKIQKNTRQVKQLEQTRDTLLPKLMSGAVRVN